MKKALSILLAVAVLLSCLTATAFAAEQNGKISESLQNVLANAADDTKIEAHIWLYCQIDESEIFRQAIQECGYIGGLPLNMTLEEVYAYKAVYNRLVCEQEAAVANAFVEKLGIADEDIVYLGKHNYVVAKLTKAQIRTAASYSEVESVSVGNTPTITSTETPTEPKSGELYKERLKEQYNLDDFDFESGRDGLMYYKELTYHCDNSGAVDWALVYCYTNMMNPMEMTAVIGHRVVNRGDWMNPFRTGYGVYDVKNDRFIDATLTAANELDEFVRVFDEVGTGRFIGDLDRDDEISIIDATLIQRCEAHICDYPEDDEFRVTADFGRTAHYYSDFDQDGERSIIDATRMQRYLANVG